MDNGNFEKNGKPFRGKSHSKKKPYKSLNEISDNKIKNKHNNLHPMLVVNNKAANPYYNSDIQDNLILDENQIKHFFSQQNKESFSKSRPPTQNIIKRNSSPFEVSSKIDKNNFNSENFKVKEILLKDDKSIKESNFLKFNKKSNSKAINDLIPFNDIYKKNKNFKSNGRNDNKNTIKSGKYRATASDLNNFLINQNEIFDLKKKVIQEK